MFVLTLTFGMRGPDDHGIEVSFDPRSNLPIDPLSDIVDCCNTKEERSNDACGWYQFTISIIGFSTRSIAISFFLVRIVVSRSTDGARIFGSLFTGVY
jgi:hypothetical protein